MSRTDRFLGGLGLGYLNQVSVVLAGLWLTPFFLHRLGQHDYGVWLMVAQVTGFLSLLDLGVVGLLPREVARAVGNQRVASLELQRHIGQAMRLVLWQLPLVIVCSAVVWLVGHSAWKSAGPWLGVILATFTLLFPLRLFAAVLQGLQDLAFLGRLQIGAWIVSTVLSIVLIAQGQGLMALALSWACNQIVTTLFCYWRFRRNVPGAFERCFARVDRTSTIEYLKKSAWLSVSQVAQILNAGSDILLVGRLLGPNAAVPYSCTGKLASVLANKPQLLMHAALPGLSHLRAAESKARIRQVTEALGQAMLISSGAVLCLVIAVNRSFVHWWIGPGQYGGALLNLFIAVAMLLRHWNVTFTYTLFCFGNERRLALTALADGCAAVLSSLILIPLLGPLGAPLGAMVGTCAVNLPANLTALSREMGVSRFALLSSARTWPLRLTLMCAVAAAVGNWWSPSTVAGIALASSFVATLYLIVMAPMLFQEPLAIYVRPKLRFLVSRVEWLKPLLAEAD